MLKSYNFTWEDTKYNEEETKFLVDGFKNGFDLGYRGPEEIQQTSNNLKFTNWRQN